MWKMACSWASRSLPSRGLPATRQAFEVVEHVGLDALQPGLACLGWTVRLHAEGQVLGLDKTIVAPCQLGLQHLAVLGANRVEIIPLHGIRTLLAKVSPEASRFKKDS